MFENFKVKVPVSGRITVRKLKPGQEGKSIYVEYARDRVYNPKTKHMIPKNADDGYKIPTRQTFKDGSSAN